MCFFRHLVFCVYFCLFVSFFTFIYSLPSTQQKFTIAATLPFCYFRRILQFWISQHMVIPDFMFKYHIFASYTTKSQTAFHIDRRTSDSGFSMITSLIFDFETRWSNLLYLCVYLLRNIYYFENYFEIFRKKKNEKKNHTHTAMCLYSLS